MECPPAIQPALEWSWDYLTPSDSGAGERRSVGNGEHHRFTGEKAHGHPGVELGRGSLRHRNIL